MSVTVTVPVTAEPSVVSTSGLAAELVISTPDRLSADVKGIETFVLFQPLALAAGLATPNVSVGGVLSILMPEMLVGLALLPAASVQAPSTDWFEPSVVTLTFNGL